MYPGIASASHQRWWTEGDNAYAALWSTIDHLRQNDGGRQAELRKLAGLYLDRPPEGLGPDQYYRTGAGTGNEARIRLNVTRTMVDAVTAKIAKNKPRAVVLTDGGNFGLQQRSKRLDDFLWGLFTRTQLHKKSRVLFRDAAIFKTGIWKYVTNVESGKIGVERVYPWDLWVDPVDAYHGSPRSYYQSMLVDRGVLLGLVERWHKKSSPQRRKEARLAVENAAVCSDSNRGGDRYADQIDVVEGWHLKSHDDAKDGKHIIAIKEGELFGERWDSPRPPFTFYHWNEPVIGFWGTSLVEEAEGSQRELTELVAKIAIATKSVGVPWILKPAEAGKIVFDNDPRGLVITYKGGIPPQIVSSSGVPAEMFAHLDRLTARIYEEQGISQLSASSKKPPGIDAAVALQELNDIESERFFPKGQGFEDAFVDAAHQMIEAARRIEAAGGKVEVQAQRRRRGRSFLARIKWSEVAMDDDVFDVKIFPANSLPKSPPARIQAVTGLVQAGFLSMDEARPLMDFPDLDTANARASAPYEMILDILETITEEGRMIPPRPNMNLGLALKVMNDSLLRLEIDRAPDETLTMVREWIALAEKMIADAEAAAQAAAAPPAAPMPPDGGVPMPEAVPPEIAAQAAQGPIGAAA